MSVFNQTRFWQSFHDSNIELRNGIKHDQRYCVEPLYKSESFTISDFNSYAPERYIFRPGYTAEFCMNFTRRGYFLFNAYKVVCEEYISRILIEKPNCEFRLVQQEPGFGACTIFRFTEAGFNEITERFELKNSNFFNDPDAYSTIVSASPEAEYIHYFILENLLRNNTSRLLIDSLVMEMVTEVMKHFSEIAIVPVSDNKNKRHYIQTVERAKEFILDHFTKNISLNELASHCYVSPFHFSRIFKQYSNYSPYQYLQLVRLKHAETLIRTTDLPIADVCFRSGFNRVDYFSTAFAKKFLASPSKYKQAVS